MGMEALMVCKSTSLLFPTPPQKTVKITRRIPCPLLNDGGLRPALINHATPQQAAEKRPGQDEITSATLNA
jgi:hypothetical protein